MNPGRVLRTASLLLAGALVAIGPAASPASPHVAPWAGRPSPMTGERTPGGTPVCSRWVHDRYTALGPDGERYATWHPQVDPLYRCAFGHEHGSDPRRFVGWRVSGMPAFGFAAAVAGMRKELTAHSGFKVFVVNDDGRGKAWMLVLHQGTGSPRRAAVRRHGLELWMFGRRPGAAPLLLAHVHVMADFGDFVPNCPDTERQGTMRLVPQVGCDDPYEEWDALFDVGGFLTGRPGFGVENPTTRFDPADPAGRHPNLPAVCGPGDPFGWESTCKGDRRTILHPAWKLANTGPTATFVTDPFGAPPVDPGSPTILQFARRGVVIDESSRCCGRSVIYTLRDPANGGVYRRGRGASPAGFDAAGSSVRWPN